jgi:hypothetical protein
LVEVRNMIVRYDHHMSAGVWIEIQDNKVQVAAMDDIAFFIALFP